MGIVAEDHEAAVHHAGTGNRDIVEHVLRLFKARGGVDITAEFRADGTQIVQDGLVREVLGSVEAHVLQEVGQTVLCRILFLNSSHIGGQIELCTAGGKLIVTDEIGETVVQVAGTDLVRSGNLGHLGNGSLHLFAGRLLSKGHNSSYSQST